MSKRDIELAAKYGIEKVVVHGGDNSWIYDLVWYVEQAFPTKATQLVPDTTMYSGSDVGRTICEMVGG